jgi:transposase
MVTPLGLRPISNDEGNRLLGMVRRGAGSIVTWRRAQIVLWAAQGYAVARIAEIGFTSEDRVRGVIHNFNRDGFSSLSPAYAGGRPPKFDAGTRAEIARVALCLPRTLGRPYTRWSLTKLANHLVEAGVVEDISTESIRRILDEEGISYQRLKTWKESNDPDYEAKKDLIWALVHGPPPECRVISVDEFGPITCQPQPGRGWARRCHPRRRRANYHKPHGVTYWLGFYDLDGDQLYGRISRRKRIGDILRLLGATRRQFPHEHLYVIWDNWNAHRSHKVIAWANHNRVGLAYTPNYASWLNPIECQFGEFDSFVIEGSDFASQAEAAAAIRAFVRYRNRRARHKLEDQPIRAKVA